MKSIKPGRGPSGMSAIGSVVVVIFGILWTIVVASSGAGFMAIFGVLFVIYGIVTAVYHYKNATSQNRYSQWDITEQGEEPDPLQQRFAPQEEAPRRAAGYCPYCGRAAEADHLYCAGCGRKLSD